MKRTILSIGIITTLMIACGSNDAPNAAMTDGSAPTGEQLFRMNCTLCHGANGKLGFNGAKDLTASTLTKAEMILRVRDGKGTMQPYKNVFTAKEIEAVVDHVRDLGRAARK